MKLQAEYQSATPADTQKVINRASRLRSEYIAKSIRSGFSNLHEIFANKTSEASTNA